MNEENVKSIAIPEELENYKVGDVLHVNFGGYEGFIKVKEYHIDNNCTMCAFYNHQICNLHKMFCTETIDRPDVVFVPLEK